MRSVAVVYHNTSAALSVGNGDGLRLGLYLDRGGAAGLYYVVTAQNAAGESGPSNTAQARGIAPLRPYWPDPLLLLPAPLLLLALGRSRRRKWAAPVGAALLGVAAVCLGAAVPGSRGAAVQRSAAAAQAPLPAPQQEPQEYLTRTITYTYDPLHRLTGAEYSTGERYEYAYDAVGNRTAYTVTTPLAGTTVTTYTYDAANRLLVSASPGHSVTYTWDDRGNLTNDGVFTYAYNSAGRLGRAQSITATIAYTYTADGLRVGQSVNGDEMTFTWDPAAGLAVVIRDTTTVYLYTPDGALLAERRDGQWTYPLRDTLGSVRQWSSDAGYVVGYVEYDPFGVPQQGIGVLDSPYGYTGEYQEKALGLIYLRVRWYAPVMGRFLQIDPWAGDYERPQSLNRFTYVENNPTNFVDPLGLCTACRQGSVVTVGGTGGIGLAARAGPSLEAKILTRLPDGTRVVIAEDTPVPGSGLWWHSTYLSQFTGMFVINYGRVWLANQYLFDDPQPLPPNSGSSLGTELRFTASPVSGVTYVQGFGATQWACDVCGGGDGMGECPNLSYTKGETECPYQGTRGLHNGLDLAVVNGTPVYWTGNVSGMVVKVDKEYLDAVPNVVIEAGGYWVVFGHLSSRVVERNKVVTAGTQLGTTGESHLHLGVVSMGGGKYYNPLYFFDSDVAITFVGLMGPYFEGEGPWSIKSYSAAGKCQGWFWGCNPDRTGIDR
jgi:RHS repeat-associated protein